jgi:hypothetical protein
LTALAERALYAPHTVAADDVRAARQAARSVQDVLKTIGRRPRRHAGQATEPFPG